MPCHLSSYGTARALPTKCYSSFQLPKASLGNSVHEFSNKGDNSFYTVYVCVFMCVCICLSSSFLIHLGEKNLKSSDFFSHYHVENCHRTPQRVYLLFSKSLINSFTEFASYLALCHQLILKGVKAWNLRVTTWTNPFSRPVAGGWQESTVGWGIPEAEPPKHLQIQQESLPEALLPSPRSRTPGWRLSVAAEWLCDLRQYLCCCTLNKAMCLHLYSCVFQLLWHDHWTPNESRPTGWESLL